MMKKNFLIISTALLLSAFCLLPTVFAQGGVKGKVRNNKGGAIAGATVTARRDGKDIKTAHADSKGLFTLQGLEAGTYNVVFEANGYASGVKAGVKISNGSIVDLGDRLILGVDQGSLVIIKGSVFYKEGTSLAAAKVEIERVNDDGSTKRLGSTQTSMQGEFTYRLPAGVTKVKVTAKYKGATGSKEITDIVNAGIYRTAITLDLSQPER
ncbi:MAG TPA: carboxypeptidase-like regulatory domain-containing protein [Pyrinomonadaceae bacterium]|nr:carboxypeptidase-like regulatory domain-containing protein [Pyrinomonadaceae bacterium]